MYRSTVKDTVNALLLPIKLVIPQPIVARLPYLTSNEDIRIAEALKWMEGYTLDIGCGNNRLMAKYREAGGAGLGVDVYDWGPQDLLVVNSAVLPFADATFDSVTMLACINHIPNREEVLIEARRVLKKDGKLILTNLTPVISRIWHKIAYWDEDQYERGMKEGECYGLTQKDLRQIISRAGFKLVKRRRFSLWLNSIYLFHKEQETL